MQVRDKREFIVLSITYKYIETEHHIQAPAACFAIIKQLTCNKNGTTQDI